MMEMLFALKGMKPVEVEEKTSISTAFALSCSSVDSLSANEKTEVNGIF